MSKKIALLCVVALFAFSCKKKEPVVDKTPEETNAAAQDTSIEKKDINFDQQGSDSGKISGLYSLHFEYDKATLTPEARSLAQKNVDWMKQNPNTTIQIEGHCDRHGSIEYNLALGERRAKAAKQYMVTLGANGKKLTVISYGKERPLDSAETDEADAKNRRANFVPQK